MGSLADRASWAVLQLRRAGVRRVHVSPQSEHCVHAPLMDIVVSRSLRT